MNPPLGVFLDASVLLAAAGSPLGGSSEAIEIVAADARYEAAVSDGVLLEARRNVDRKFAPAAGGRLIALLARARPVIIRSGDLTAPFPLPSFLAEKDEHVVRACLAAGATICLTLDRKHLLTEELRRWGMQHRLFFIRPAEFLYWHRLRSTGV